MSARLLKSTPPPDESDSSTGDSRYRSMLKKKKGSPCDTNSCCAYWDPLQKARCRAQLRAWERFLSGREVQCSRGKLHSLERDIRACRRAYGLRSVPLHLQQDTHEQSPAQTWIEYTHYASSEHEDRERVRSHMTAKTPQTVCLVLSTRSNPASSPSTFCPGPKTS